jgi:hypothetical protein
MQRLKLKICIGRNPEPRRNVDGALPVNLITTPPEPVKAGQVF